MTTLHDFFSTSPLAPIATADQRDGYPVFDTSRAEFHPVKLRVISAFLLSIYCVTLLALGAWGGGSVKGDFVASQQQSLKTSSEIGGEFRIRASQPSPCPVIHSS